ncbi:MAG: hypothetical protein K0R17_3319 [Rariglobus sp.]|jgi:hypothetical protein|nr:hypothetical protein [Rariglobus sp.]
MSTVLPIIRRRPGLSLIVWLFVSATLAADTGIGVKLAGTRILRGDRLVIEVMDPDSPERYNRGTRFTPVANVLRATLEGREFLHAPGGPGHDPLLDNGGLASEFDLFAHTPPPGFAEAAIGEDYVKIGVGVLRKTAERYDFWEVPPVVARAVTSTSWGKDRATFEQVCEGTNGYSYRLAAGVRVEGDGLEITFGLTNTGAKRFSTWHYAHNFFAFDGAMTGPGYEVQFPYELPPLILQTGSPRTQTQRGRRIVFIEALKESSNVQVPWPADYDGPNWVRLRQVESGRQITATTSMPGPFIFVHADSRYVCPEQFVRLDLKPGESAGWSRSYRFEVVSPADKPTPAHE